METWEWIVVVVILVGAVVFTLGWWKIADRWADREHRRFGRSNKRENTDAVVIKMPRRDENPAAEGGAKDRPA